MARSDLSRCSLVRCSVASISTSLPTIPMQVSPASSYGCLSTPSSGQDVHQACNSGAGGDLTKGRGAVPVLWPLLTPSLNLQYLRTRP